jgi:hypothetical protein
MARYNGGLYRYFMNSRLIASFGLETRIRRLTVRVTSLLREL